MKHYEVTALDVDRLVRVFETTPCTCPTGSNQHGPYFKLDDDCPKHGAYDARANYLLGQLGPVIYSRGYNDAAQQANWWIAALVRSAGGRLVVSAQTVDDLRDTDTLIRYDDPTNDEIVFTVPHDDVA